MSATSEEFYYRKQMSQTRRAVIFTGLTLYRMIDEEITPESRKDHEILSIDFEAHKHKPEELLDIILQSLKDVDDQVSVIYTVEGGNGEGHAYWGIGANVTKIFLFDTFMLCGLFQRPTHHPDQRLIL